MKKLSKNIYHRLNAQKENTMMNAANPSNRSAAKKLISLGAIFLALICLTGNISAQLSSASGMQGGRPAGSYNLDNFDNVNLFSGNLNFKMPLVSASGRGEAGYTVPLTLQTNWKMITGFIGQAPAYSYVQDGVMGDVSRGPGIMKAIVTGSNFAEQTCSGLPSWEPSETKFKLIFTGSDGTSYDLRSTQNSGAPSATTTCNPTAAVSHGTEFLAWDGSGVKFIADSTVQNNMGGISGAYASPSGYLLLPNGTKYRIDATISPVDGGRVVWIQDRNGNRTNFSYNSTSAYLETITDANGRVISFEYDLNSSPYGYHTKITYKGFGGTDRVIRISYKGLSDALRSGTTDFTTIGVVSDLWLPDGRKYSFLYSQYGYLARVTLPTGGVYEYDYDVLNPPIVAQFINSGAPDVRMSERRVYADGTNLSQKTTYDIEENGSYTLTTVDTFDGSSTRLSRVGHYFHGIPTPIEEDGSGALVGENAWNKGREYWTTHYAANGSTVMRMIDTVWEIGRTVSWGTFGNIDKDARILSVRTILETDQQSKVIYGYHSSAFYNLQTDVYDYGYGSGTPGSFIRRTHSDFEQSSTYVGNSVHLLRLPTQKWISSDSSGNDIVSRVRYEYDNYTADSTHAALVNRSNVTSHNSSFSTSYTTRGNLTKTTSYSNADAESGAISTYRQYDIVGNVVKSIDGRSNYNTYEYADSFGAPNANARTNTTPSHISGLQTFAFLSSSTNAAGHTTYSQVDYYIGKDVDVEDILGNVNSSFYNDTLDRPTQTIAYNNRSAFEKQTTISYDDTNRIITATSDSKAYNDNLIKIETRLDKLGRNIESRQYEDASNYIATTQQYDSLGRAYRSSNPYRPYLSETAQWTTTSFDALGRVVEIETADAASVTRAYTGNTVRVYDQDSKSRAGTTDAIGRLTQVIEYDAGSTTLETNYTYDVLARMRKSAQIDAGSNQQNRYFMYDDLGRLIRAKQVEQSTNSGLNTTDPVTGNTGWSAAYSYDSNSNVASATDARNKTVTNTYDALNRVTARDYSDSTPDLAFTYDDTNIANSKGSLTAVTSSVSSSYNLSFDELGRVTSSRQATGGTNYDFTEYIYDLSGALVSEKYPSGRIVENETNDIGRLNRVTSKLPSQVEKIMLANISYTASGAVKLARLGNGRWESAEFDNQRLQIEKISLGGSAGDSSLMKLEYDYGTTTNNGTLRQQKITVPGAAYPIVQDYTYDELNRLKSATEKVNSVNQWKQTYLYDRFGNRRFDASNTTTLPANNGTYNPGVDPLTNRFLTSDGYSYDSEGNMTANPENQAITYNAENKQVQVQDTVTSAVSNYYYDGNGKRVKKVTPTEETIFVYDAFGKLAAEYSTATDSRPKTTSYLTSDDLGSARIVTNALGQVISRHDYMPFGSEVFAGTGGRTTGQGYNGDDGVRKQFTGYERDAESGLDFAQNRYYSSKHGRFTSVDPLLDSANTKSPQTLNRYTYGLNSPYKFTDPLGLAVRHCYYGRDCNSYAADEAADNEYRNISSMPALPPIEVDVQISDSPDYCDVEFTSCIVDDTVTKAMAPTAKADLERGGSVVEQGVEIKLTPLMISDLEDAANELENMSNILRDEETEIFMAAYRLNKEGAGITLQNHGGKLIVSEQAGTVTGQVNLPRAPVSISGSLSQTTNIQALVASHSAKLDKIRERFTELKTKFQTRFKEVKTSRASGGLKNITIKSPWLGQLFNDRLGIYNRLD